MIGDDRGPDIELYARSFVDVYDAWYAHLHDPAVIVAALGARVGPQPATVVELGSGSGRLAGPLAAAGYRVVALDAAASMLELDRSPSHKVVGDMAVLPLASAGAEAVLIAYNTLFNLTTVGRQQLCLAEIARILRPGGFVAIEAFIAPPPEPHAPFGMSIIDHHTHPDGRIAIATWNDPEAPHLVTGAHIELRPDGSLTRPWRLAYQSPAEIDEAAAAVGLNLVERHADWSGAPFAADGIRHLSWYRS